MRVTTGPREGDARAGKRQTPMSSLTRLPQVLTVLMAVVACSCAPAKIGYDFDRQADFSTYHTYEWLAETQEATGDRRVDNADMDIRLRTAIGAQLHQKGYNLALQGPPDFYVAYSLGLRDRTPDESSRYLSDGMAGHAFSHSVDSRPPNAPRDTAPPPPDPTIGGSLLIDIVEATSHRLVWRGTADGKADPSLTAAERNERIRRIVRDILANFPPK